MTTTLLHSAIPRARFDEAMLQAADHLKPLVAAVRDDGCVWGTVLQHSGSFAPPGGKPTILVLGDDMLTALGPAAFDRASVDGFVKTCAFGAIISCAPLPTVYAAAARHAAVSRGNSVIVETQLTEERAWIERLKAIRPDISLVVATVQPGHA